MSMSYTELAARADVVGKILRDFSAAGPCIVQGTVTRETGSSLFYTDRDGAERRMGKAQRWTSGLLHVAACYSCRDHAKTQYPNGYTD